MLDDDKPNLELAKINKALLELKANKNPHLYDSVDEEERQIQEEIKRGFTHFIMNNKDVPKKAAITSFLLLIGGIILLITALVKGIEGDHSRMVLVYTIAGILFSIPGFYFTVKICKAFKTKDKNTRRDMLNEIPDM